VATIEPSRPTPSDARILRWQWTLANGGTVAAVIDRGGSTETVSQGTRVLSQSARGGKPDGHTVMVDPEREPDRSERPGIEAVVTFAPGTAVCILRVDGHEVAPSAWPVRPPAVTPKPTRPYGAWALIGIGVLALVTFGLVVRTTRGEPPRIDPKLGGTYRALNGLFIAHYPDDFEARLAVLPPGAGGIILEDTAKTTTIVFGAMPNETSGMTDPWVLQQRLHDEAVANLPKGTARYEEGARREETCLGKPGAVVTGKIMSSGKAKARVWSCAFVHDAAGYLALYMLAEPAGTADERRARAVIDTTELTHLADLGMLPPGLTPTDPLGTGGTLPVGSLPRLDLPR
jgi:hypothetical protein